MISTGLTKLDDFLTNGLPIGCITDIFGASGTGKTQLLFQISINCIKNGGNVIYLDTIGEFRPERIVEIANKQNIDSDILNKLTVFRITNTSEQSKSVTKIKNSDPTLVIIDNVTELFSYEYDEEELIFKKNFLFMRFMHNLSSTVIEKRIPAVVTNTIRHIDGKEIESMGASVDLYSHVKIHLSKINSKLRCDSRYMGKKQTLEYSITASGLVSN